jgi:hypothetical protein
MKEINPKNRSLKLRNNLFNNNINNHERIKEKN